MRGTKEYFQQSEKQEAERYLLMRTGTNFRACFCKTTAGMPSSPQSFCGSSLQMIVENIDGVMYISLGSDYILWGKSGECPHEHSRVELKKNFCAKYSTISAVYDNDSGLWKRGRIEDLVLFATHRDLSNI